MKNQNILESVPLVPKYVTLNPEDLKVFDEAVGKGNRSATIRNLIREFNRNNKMGSSNEMVQTSDSGS